MQCQKHEFKMRHSQTMEPFQGALTIDQKQSMNEQQTLKQKGKLRAPTDTLSC